jgi:GSH-dependent disulfide-bond oxidoreductase
MAKADAAARAASQDRMEPTAAAKPHSSAKASSPKTGTGAFADTQAQKVKPTQRPIDLYYWPTPNGWKISIMLEECELPYTMVPVNIGKRQQFEPAFEKIAPNNRIPAIVDPDGPGDKPISVFESGAILQYLGRKTGKFYPEKERDRVEVDQWLFWQVAGLGPIAGQANHFRHNAPEQIKYAIDRYTNEVNRLYGLMNRRLEGREYLAAKYSIADISTWGWVASHMQQSMVLPEYTNVKAWYERIGARPAVQRGFALGRELRATQHIDIRSNLTVRRKNFNPRTRP